MYFAVAGCTPNPETAYDLLQEDTFWTLVSGDTFADGGSVALSFINSDGQIIHLWAQGSSGSDAGPRRFFLKRTYNDPQPVEVVPGSSIEERVLTLLESFQRRPYVNIPESYPKHFVSMLRDRKHPFPDNWLTFP